MDGLEKVKAAYSFWGRFPSLYFLQDFVTFMGRPSRIRKAAVTALGAKAGDGILEVACGNGRNSPYVLAVIGERGTLVGLDYSPEMLAAARRLSERRGWKNVRLVEGDAALLQVGEGFDGVFSVLGISAIPAWERALVRCQEVLRRGGVLVVCDARPFRGPLRFLNPLIKAVYSRFAAWDPEKDISGKMREIFGNVRVETHNLGTFFIAKSVKGK